MEWERRIPFIYHSLAPAQAVNLADFQERVNFLEDMIEKTISDLEAKVRAAGTVNDAHKQELLSLLGKLKAQVSALEQTHSAEAKSIAQSVQASTQQVTEKPADPESLKNSVAGLRSSVEGFEQSHPQLVQVVNSLSNMLSNLGI